MVPETWEGILKLLHDATLTMEQVNSEFHVHQKSSVGWSLQAAPKLSVGLETLSIRSLDWSVRVALMVPETREGILKLPHDTTLTMEQVNSELNVHGTTSVGLPLQAAPKLSVGV